MPRCLPACLPGPNGTAAEMAAGNLLPQNAIRKKTESLNYLRLGSRLDAVVSRLDTQAKMQTVNRSMVSRKPRTVHLCIRLPTDLPRSSL